MQFVLTSSLTERREMSKPERLRENDCATCLQSERSEVQVIEGSNSRYHPMILIQTAQNDAVIGFNVADPDLARSELETRS